MQATRKESRLTKETKGETAGATGTTNNKLLIYNYAVDKWSTGSGQDLEFMASASQEAFTTLESLDLLGDLDNLPKSLDS